MKKKSILVAFLVILAQNIFAQWDGIPSSVNNPVSNATEAENSIFSVTDGAGGAILAWLAYDNNTSRTLVYAQRKTATGAIGWSTAATPLLLFTGAVNGYAEINDLVADGAGGAYITWVNNLTDTTSDIYLQRISSTGTKLFTATGIKLNPANGHNFSDASVCTDPTGIIVCWSDQISLTTSNIPTYAQVFAQRYNTSGSPQWGAGGVQVSTAPGLRAVPSMISDGSNGAFISFSDARNSGIDINGDFDNIDLYAQHISSTGNRLWSATDVVVTTELFNQFSLGTYEFTTAMISDNAGGFILIYNDYRNDNDGPGNFYAQRLNGAGTRIWASGGIPLGNPSTRSKYKVSLVNDGASGMVAAWDETDNVSGSGAGYAQRITNAGVKSWGTGGIVISGSLNTGYANSTMASDGAGSYVINWSVYDIVNDIQIIKGQKLDGNGAAQWAVTGVNICTNPLASPRYPVIVPGTSGTMLVAWEDDRNNATSGTDIYAAWIGPTGNLINTSVVNYISSANGNWNSTATWAGNVVPPAGANVIIRHNVTGNMNTSCNSLRVESTGMLTVKTGIIITVLK